MGKYEDFTWVGKVVGAVKHDRREGGPKFKITTHGAGPNAGNNPDKPLDKNIWIFQQDRDGNDQVWWPTVQAAILNNDVLVFEGYKQETPKSTEEKPAFFWNATDIKVWDGSEQAGAATSASSAPAPSSLSSRENNQIQVQPPAPTFTRIDQTPGEISRWAVATILTGLQFFGDAVPEDPRERAKFVEDKAVGLTKLAANVEKRITPSD